MRQSCRGISLTGSSFGCSSGSRSALGKRSVADDRAGRSDCVVRLTASVSDWLSPDMCGIGAILNLDGTPVEALGPRLVAMNRLLVHRGPDGEGAWIHPRGHVGLAHRRLEVIDLTTGDQPMWDDGGNWITYNGEIYNY